MKQSALEQDEIRTIVRQQYGNIANQDSGCGCAPTCCGRSAEPIDVDPDKTKLIERLGYTAAQASTIPDEANLGLGCGNPQIIAALRPGETVLDLGSGAGFDSFLAAKAVGATGLVIGVDMTPEMIRKARKNQASAGVGNVEFRLGEIENLPVSDGSVDVIISNCVINLSPNKMQVFREAFRVLKAGGRLAISDVVALMEIPESMRQEWEVYTGCVAGAATVADLTTALTNAGFSEIQIVPKANSSEIIREWFPGRRMEEFVVSATIQAIKPGQLS